MPNDRSLEYRATAAKCLKLAARATDPVRRTEYLALAQIWKDLAIEATAGASALAGALREFNNQQFRKGGQVARPAQQQQQIQPKKPEGDPT